MFKSSKPPSVKVVRKKQADGTIKEYTYERARYKQDNAAGARPAGHIEPGTVSDLIRQFMRAPDGAARAADDTKYKYRMDLGHLERFLGDQHPENVTRASIIEIRDEIFSGFSDNPEQTFPGAAQNFVRHVARLFNWAAETDRIPHPLGKIKRLEHGTYPTWSLEQYEAAMQSEHFSPAIKRALFVAFFTGQRRGDLVRMRYDQVRDGKLYMLGADAQQKTGVELVLPLPPYAVRTMQKWRRNESDLILTDSNAEQWVSGNLSAYIWRAVRRAGLPEGLNIHGLRKLAAVNLAHRGCTENQLRAWFGWTTSAMPQLYTRAAEQERLAEQVAEKMATMDFVGMEDRTADGTFG